MTAPTSKASATGLIPIAAVLTAMVSITIGASYAKQLFPVIGPTGATALRLVMAAAILSIALRVWRVRFTRASLRAALAYGLAMGAMNLLFYLAIQRLELGIALAFEFTGPLAVALYYSRSRTDLAWIALAVTGLLLLLPIGLDSHGLDMVGVAYALAAGVFWATYIVTGQKAGQALGIQATAVGMIVAALLAFPFGIASAGADLLHPAMLAGGLAVALLSSALPYSLEMFALKRLPAKSFGIMTSAEPAVGAVMAMLLLGEILPPLKWLGIGAIVLASLGTALTHRQGAGDAGDVAAP